MAASLVAKVARCSLDSWAEAAGALAQSDVLQARCVELAGRDAEAFGTALAALAEGVSVEAPLARAAAVALEIGEVAADVALLAARAAEQGEGSFRADAASAAALAEGSAGAAAALVASNLTVTEGDQRLEQALRYVDTARFAAKRAFGAGP